MMNGVIALDGADTAREHDADALSNYQIGALVVVGVVFWFGAAMTVRFGAPMGMFGPAASAGAFAAAFPVAWLGVLLAIPAARMRPRNLE